MGAFDVVVVGNGVVAHSVVVALATRQPTLRVAIVGTAERRGAASPAAGAMLGCFGEVTKQSLESEYGRQKLALAVQAAELWPEWVCEVNDGLPREDALDITSGTFILLNGASAALDDENYVAIQQALTRYGRTVSEVDAATIPGLDPLEHCRPLRAMYLPNEGSIDSARLLARLEAKVNANPRVTSIKGLVEQLIIVSSKVLGVVVNGGQSVEAPVVILAAGFDTQRVLDKTPELARRIPRLFPGAGTSIILQPVDDTSPITSVLRTPNRSFACGLHVVPRSQGRVYVGATNHVRLNPWLLPTAYDVHFLIECAMEQIRRDLQAASLVGTNVGNRPIAIDGFPLIGSTSVGGLWLLTGTYRDGLHLSPLLAQNMAREVLGDKCIGDHFLPERLPLVTMTRQQAVSETVKHHLAVGFEHAMRLPGGWHQQLEDLFVKEVATFYEEIGSSFVLPPEFITMIIASRSRGEIIDFFRSYYDSVSA